MPSIRQTLSFPLATIFLAMLPPLAVGQQTDQAPTEEEIGNRVAEVLRRDSAVQAWEIDASAENGTVVLTGTVTSLREKQRAERLARTLRGVDEVNNNIEVQFPEGLSLPQLEEDIQEEMLIDPAVEAAEVSVEVEHGGAVRLTGTVDSWQERALVERVVSGVYGVTAVDNNVEVAVPLDREDADIETDIQQALRYDVRINHEGIDVDVEDGVVTLSGTVGSALEKTQAIVIAWTAGVEDVRAEDLNVEKWARREAKTEHITDNDIRQAIRRSFLYDPRVNRFDINIEVEDGRVTLEGRVGTIATKREAERIARNTVGVTEVVNNISTQPEVLSPPESLTDPRIEERVETAILRNPYLEDFEIRVDVLNGVAALSGQVDTRYERMQAEEVAGRVRGVLSVTNNIQVEDTFDPMIPDPYVDSWEVDDYARINRQPGEQSMGDNVMEEEVEDQLWWSPFVDSDEVEVFVEDGRVTLSGQVDSFAERNAAEENAYQAGANWVDNQLVVR